MGTYLPFFLVFRSLVYLPYRIYNHDRNQQYSYKQTPLVECRNIFFLNYLLLCPNSVNICSVCSNLDFVNVFRSPFFNINCIALLLYNYAVPVIYHNGIDVLPVYNTILVFYANTLCRLATIDRNNDEQRK